MNNFMRLLVMFDLPVTTKQERTAAARFRKFLLDDGYYMVQFSVYARICNGRDAAQKHELRLKCALPARGSVRSLVVTEKQYTGMRILIGAKRDMETPAATEQVSFF